eukprot:1131359-Prymnesium_polylepis.1
MSRTFSQVGRSRARPRTARTGRRRRRRRAAMRLPRASAKCRPLRHSRSVPLAALRRSLGWPA